MQSMDSVYREYAEFVYKFLLSLCGEVDTAEELTQETFYQAMRSWENYNGTCKVSTWLCQIAKHLWYQEKDRRKRKKTEPLTEEIASQKLVTQALDEELIFQEEKMRLYRMVHTLDETAKEVVLLRIANAFSFKEIGELFGKSENWARVTYYRAKQKIVKGWEKE